MGWMVLFLVIAVICMRKYFWQGSLIARWASLGLVIAFAIAVGFIVGSLIGMIIPMHPVLVDAIAMERVEFPDLPGSYYFLEEADDVNGRYIFHASRSGEGFRARSASPRSVINETDTAQGIWKIYELRPNDSKYWIYAFTDPSMTYEFEIPKGSLLRLSVPSTDPPIVPNG